MSAPLPAAWSSGASTVAILPWLAFSSTSAMMVSLKSLWYSCGVQCPAMSSTRRLAICSSFLSTVAALTLLSSSSPSSPRTSSGQRRVIITRASSSGRSSARCCWVCSTTLASATLPVLSRVWRSSA